MSSNSSRVPIVEKIMNANDQVADLNRGLLNANQVLAINIMASPGAGKTSFILKTIEALAPDVRTGVVEGDTAPVTIDADKISAVGMPAVQINTGGECHLDAMMLRNGLQQLPLDAINLMIVENVGNLICPAAFNLGTHFNVLIINKIDLLPYVRFNMDYFRQGVEVLNPGLVTFTVSCVTGEGIADWVSWLKKALTELRSSSGA